MLFGKERRWGNFLVGLGHFPLRPTKNPFLWIGEKTSMKSLLLVQLPYCHNLMSLSLSLALLLFCFVCTATSNHVKQSNNMSKGIIVNLYKFRFLYSHFSPQQNKKDFHFSTFPFLQPNTLRRKTISFISFTFSFSRYFLFSHIFIIPTK